MSDDKPRRTRRQKAAPAAPLSPVELAAADVARFAARVGELARELDTVNGRLEEARTRLATEAANATSFHATDTQLVIGTEGR